jgi:membrane-associated protease RseP (regulator of RpoE activity)
MSILLNRAYAGHAAGTVVTFPDQLETALIAQGIATASTKSSVAAGNVTANVAAGTVAIAAGASSVVITSDKITPATKVFAAVAQAAADGTLLRIDRIVVAAGQVTLYGNANATAKTLVDWSIIPQPGMTLG